MGFLGIMMKTPWRCEVEETLHRSVGVLLCVRFGLFVLESSIMMVDFFESTKSKTKTPLHNFCTMNAHRREDYST